MIFKVNYDEDLYDEYSYGKDYSEQIKNFYEFAEKIVNLIFEGKSSEALSTVESFFQNNCFSPEQYFIYSRYENFLNHVKYCCDSSETLSVDDLRFTYNHYDLIPYNIVKFMLSNYVDCVFKTSGLEYGLMILKDNAFLLSDLDEKILEVSLYSQAEDIENLYENLLDLKDIYKNSDSVDYLIKTLIRKSHLKDIDKNSDSVEAGALLLRLADCEYKLGKFEKSIETAKEAYSLGCWIFGYANQIVESYIALKEYGKAREFVDSIAPLTYKLKKTERLESYEISLYDIPFYFKDRINSAEKSKESNNISILDDDFIKSCLLRTPVNKYELQIVLHRIRKKMENRFYEQQSGAVQGSVYDNLYLDGLASDYLSAAYIVRHFYGYTQEYYQYLSKGLFFSGVLSQCIRGFNENISYIAALKTGFMIQENSTFEDSINTLYCGYCNSTDNLDKLNLKNLIINMKTRVSSSNYLEKITNNDCFFLKYSPVVRSNFNSENEKKVLDEVDKRFMDADKKYNDWLAAVKQDIRFNRDLTYVANEVKKTVLIFESDKKFIEEYLDSVAGMEEFYKYSDFDNRLIVAERALQKLNDLESSVDRKGRETTIFFENYLRKVIVAAKTNLKNIIERLYQEFVAKVTIDVPVRRVVPNNYGNINIALSISNAPNRAPVKELRLVVENVDGEKIYQKNLSNKYLQGGASISEIINISTGGQDSFSINIKAFYAGGFAENNVQISVDSGNDFEEIHNHYIPGNPVQNDDMFFGRDDLIKRLELSLKDDRTRCIVIYGQKRSGKSSIFEHLKRKLTDKFIVLNFSAGADMTSESNFYRCVQNVLTEYAEDNDFDENIVKDLENCDVSDFLNFEKFIRKAKRVLCKPQGKELLLMIDEFTLVYKYIKDSNHDIGENFMDIWKEMSERNMFKSALIGQDNMPEFIDEYPNQFQVTDLRRVSYLERQYAKDLIVKPILLSNGKSRYREGADDKIADWFNGQPFFIQQYCNKLVEYLHTNKENYIPMAVAEHVKNEMLAECREASFDNLVYAKEGETCDADWTVLKKIASSDVEDVPVDISSLSEDEKTALDKLTDREVLTKKQDRYTIKIPFFREWIREYK